MGMEGRAAVVTGGAQGIGRAIVERLLERGVSVALFDVDREAGRETESELASGPAANGAPSRAGEPPRPRAVFIPCDVAAEGDVRRGIEETVRAYGRLDFLVNNAGVFARTPVEELSVVAWERVLAVNLTGAFLCAKHAAPHLRTRRGAIVNVSSTRAVMSERDTEAYSASKGGLIALTHALAVSLGPEVRVNCVSPGWVDVSALRKRSARKEERLSDSDHAQHPAGRVGRANDVASMVLFLLDPLNDFVTGQTFVVDGGMTRKMIYVE